MGIVEDMENLCVLTEEVIDSVYAGSNLTKAPDPTLVDHLKTTPRRRGSSSAQSSTKSPVIVIMDIAWHSSWNFDIDIGAFRRILMNLLSNAIKYTDVGFVRVTLNLEHESKSQGEKSHPTLCLTVSDSGKGISEEFLRNHLYTAFKQEDALAVGTGLGLSIVRQVLFDLDGDINIESELGSGTQASVSIPLKASRHCPSDYKTDVVSEVTSRVKDLSVCLVNNAFNIYPDMLDAPTGILSAEAEAMILLKSSVGSMMAEWFGMAVVTAAELDLSSADVHVTMGSDIEERIGFAEGNQSKQSRLPTIIVLCSALTWGTNFTTQSGLNVFYLQLP